MVYSKRIETFLKEVYNRRPEMRRHPDYRMFYLYTDYPKVQESIIVLTSGVPIPLEGIGDDMITFGKVLGFEVEAMDWNVFESEIKKHLESEYTERRGSQFRIIFHEIW
jgi:hypothetical protein